jgi:sensor histidine kinase YesM
MIEGVSFRNPVFVNTIGHTSGIFVFGLLIVLLLRSGGTLANRQKMASLAASCLALLWNLGSLIGLAFLQRDGQVADWLVAVNFSVLSLLPAVLFSVLLKHGRRWLVPTGYGISLCAVALHFYELRFQSGRLHETGLMVITIGYAALGAAVLISDAIKQRRDKRTSITDVICLMLFAFSFLHFGYGHSRTAWTSEVALHHAGIPLALVVLLRDYRLLVAETFIRFIANAGLAGLFTFCLYFANGSGNLTARANGNGFMAALLIIAFCFSLILFAWLRAAFQKLLTRFVFGRGDLNVFAKHILEASSECETEEEFLQHASTEISRFVKAERFQLAQGDMEGSDRWAEVELPLRFSRGDSFTLLLGRRQGSRRYLAEDVNALQSLTRLMVEQVERLRANQLQRLVHEAELRALQAQVNPHFLFNALNTLYGIIGRESLEARRLILNLADLFRYCLQRHRMLIPLGEELEIVQAYLEIESLRLNDRLTFEVIATPAARKAEIPVLSVQPLVENAIKHGISKLNAKGQVQVIASEQSGVLEIVVRDNGPGLDPANSTPGLGMGIENVRQRLRLCCGPGSELNIESNGQGCVATLRVVPNLYKRLDHRQSVAADPISEPAPRL